jgi:hypothetical protein
MFSGCDDGSEENDGKQSNDYQGCSASKQIAENFAVKHFASYHFRLFDVEKTIYNRETNEWEVFVRCADGEIEGSIVLYVYEDGGINIRKSPWRN